MSNSPVTRITVARPEAGDGVTRADQTTPAPAPVDDVVAAPVVRERVELLSHRGSKSTRARSAAAATATQAPTSGAGTAGPSPAPPGATAVIVSSLLAALAALLLALISAPPGNRSVRLVSLVERPG
jgi:hypothetical protein